MKKLRNLIALCAVFSMAAFLTGCGDDDDGNNNDNQPQGPQFAPADANAFRANNYTITLDQGQTAQLTFPSANTYNLVYSDGQSETGTITGLTRNGEDYIATLQPANNEGGLRAGEMRAHFTQRTSTSFTGTITAQTDEGTRTYPFTATTNSGGSTSGSTSGSTAGTTSGSTSGTTSGTTDGSTAGTTAGTTSGSTAGTTSGTTSGTTDGSTAGTTAGTTSGSTAGTTSGTPGEPPQSLVGKTLQLNYGPQGERFDFTSESSGVYETGPDTINYTWNRADTRVVLSRRNSAGVLIANYDIKLNFNANSGSQGTASVIYTEPNGSQSTDPATFTLQ